MLARYLFLLFLISCANNRLENISKPNVKTLEKRRNELLQTNLTAVKLEDRVPPCPLGMAYVGGDFCPDVEQKCLHWLDPDNKGVNGPTRCAQFEYPSKCLSKKKVHMRFCMDIFEWPNKENEVPATHLSYYDMERNCKADGKRLCSASEHAFACEGPEMQPYPYGNGYYRDSSACNIDKPWRDPFLYDSSGRQIGEKSLELLDQRTASGAHKNCVSPFGIYDIVGNVDEWYVNPSGRKNKAPWYSGLKSGHWAIGARNRCRPMTTAHGPTFSFYETGGRCCLTPKN
jgi:hypothetical protein